MERFQGEIEWLEWDKGVLTFVPKANDRDEPGINILDEGGWGYAGREPELDASCAIPGAKSHVFGRYGDGSNQHLMQVQFLKKTKRGLEALSNLAMYAVRYLLSLGSIARTRSALALLSQGWSVIARRARTNKQNKALQPETRKRLLTQPKGDVPTLS